MSHTQSEKAVLRQVLKYLLPVAFLALGAGTAVFFFTSRPVMHRAKTVPHAPVVDVQTARSKQASVIVKGQGSVAASQEVVLEPEVAGKVASLSDQFLPGGRIAAGEEILRLDKKEYEIELLKAKGNYEVKRADLELEHGQQKVVKEVFDALDETAKTPMLETNLVLREPNLKQAMAYLEVEKAAVQDAELDVERTVIKAPFNSLVTERVVGIGSSINAHEELGTIVSTDAYWINVAVPVDRLPFIDFDAEGGCPAKVYSQTSDGVWNGRVLRLTGTLAENSRLAKVLVEVKDPLGLQAKKPVPPLLIGDYVRVEIQGKAVKNVVELPRSALRMDDTVWIAHGGSLDIRKVELAWKGDETVLVKSGIVDGDKIVLSDLSSSVQGMQLVVRDKPEKKITAMAPASELDAEKDAEAKHE